MAPRRERLPAELRWLLRWLVRRYELRGAVILVHGKVLCPAATADNTTKAMGENAASEETLQLLIHVPGQAGTAGNGGGERLA